MSTQNEIGASSKTAFRTSLTESATTDIEGVGTLRQDQYGNIYRWVYNAHTAVVSLGETVFHTFSNLTLALQQVARAAAANLSFMAGIVASTTIPTLNYGWIMVLGNNADALVVNQVTTPVAAGAALVGVNAVLWAALGTAMGTAPIYKRHLIALEAVATVTLTTLTSAAAHDCYVSCL